jgi:hypothetical protein
MLVTRAQLVQYDISADLFFSRRTGDGEPVSRDNFFVMNVARLKPGLFCAIGSDSNGWELEQYNGVNWKTIDPDPNYSLVITTAGLAALTDVTRGGIKLYFTGIKIINHTITDPSTPVVNWTDNDFLQAGEVVFSVGTKGAKWTVDADGNPYINQILKWRFNTASGGLQYIISLPPEGLGAIADDGKEQWNIGAIGLYVKDPTNNTSDVLFGVATLPNTITKYATSVSRVGNAIRLYFNAILSNLGVVSNLDVINEAVSSIPEVPNESMLIYPNDPKMRPYNCYVVDSLYGSGIPALAVPRTLTSENPNDPDWAYFQPADNFVNVRTEQFASDVNNYTFVYWNTTSLKYELAQGRYFNDPAAPNEKMPIGLRVGNSIVYSGEIVNKSVPIQYSVELAAVGADYELYDELLILAAEGLNLKVKITGVNEIGGITSFAFVGPSVGNIKLEANPLVLPAVYDPRSQLPRYGSGARFIITAVEQPAFQWNFPAEWLNKPLYCDKDENAGKPTLTKTDSFLGWCTSTNSIRLALDLRNEASTAVFGTTRYATDFEVKEVLTNANSADQSAVTPKVLKDNYLQTTIPTNPNQTGSRLGNPINVESYVRFDKIVLGKGTKAPFDSTTANPYITDSGISFYGTSFRAWWADLGEYYEADKFYEPGTLITVGKGSAEISIAIDDCNGVISTKPGYQLGERKTDLHLPVALVGRVPVLMDGNCMPKFGDKIYLSRIKKGHASTVEYGRCLGKVIDKNPGTKKLVECSVRIDF